MIVKAEKGKTQAWCFRNPGYDASDSACSMCAIAKRCAESKANSASESFYILGAGHTLARSLLAVLKEKYDDSSSETRDFNESVLHLVKKNGKPFLAIEVTRDGRWLKMVATRGDPVILADDTTLEEASSAMWRLLG